MKHYWNGAKKFIASFFKRNQVDNTTRVTRKLTCAKCPQNIKMRGLGSVGQCAMCGCFIAAKIKLKDEKCPLEKW